MTSDRIYLDHNASTPVAAEVAEAMRPYLQGAFGNPSSGHWASTPARRAVELARAQVAALLGPETDEIVFTSGGSEANNMALKGIAWARRDRGNHIITSTIEHPAILEPCAFLTRLGFRITHVPVDGDGKVDPDHVASEMTSETILVSIGHANGEVGTIQSIEAISELTRSRGVLLHTDAAQSVGKIPTKVDDLGVDLLSVAGHKMYAPVGIGALYVRRGIELEPLIHGGGHESGRRSGTESALLAVGLGQASELAAELSPMDDVRELRDAFWTQLRQAFGDNVCLNGHATDRLPNTLNVSFVGQPGADVLSGLNGVAAATGSACHTDSVELSPVLKAMGVSPHIGMGAVRFSLGRDTTKEELGSVLRQLRETQGLPTAQVARNTG